MSKFIDKLNQLSRAAPQPMGFMTKQPALPKPKIQLVASLAQDSADHLANQVTGADAGLVRISKLSTGAKILQKISQAMPDMPWGGWLQEDSDPGDIKQMLEAGCDFVIFPANTPLTIFENDEVGKILQVEASLAEGLLRTANQLPVDAVLITGEEKGEYLLTWQHLMLFQRFANLLTKPLLAPIPANVTARELQSLWETGVDSVVTEVTVDQAQDRIMRLRQVIDQLAFPLPRRHEKMEVLLPRIGAETAPVPPEEEEE